MEWHWSDVHGYNATNSVSMDLSIGNTHITYNECTTHGETVLSVETQQTPCVQFSLPTVIYVHGVPHALSSVNLTMYQLVGPTTLHPYASMQPQVSITVSRAAQISSGQTRYLGRTFRRGPIPGHGYRLRERYHRL